MRWLLSLGCGFCVIACADVGANVRARAAHDFGCNESATRVVDEVVGVYRIEGCGFAATYACDDGSGGVTSDCTQIYIGKLDEPGGPKLGAPTDLAKTR